MYDYLSTVSFCLEPLERSAFTSFLDAELDDEQSEDFKTAFRWANKCVREFGSFKMPLLAYLQEKKNTEEAAGGNRGIVNSLTPVRTRASWRRKTLAPRS